MTALHTMNEVAEVLGRTHAELGNSDSEKSVDSVHRAFREWRLRQTLNLDLADLAVMALEVENELKILSTPGCQGPAHIARAHRVVTEFETALLGHK